MNRKPNVLRIYLPIFLAVMAAAVTLRTCALFIDFNTSTIYFDGKILINAANIVAAAGSVLLFTYAFASDKKIALIASFSTPATYIPTTLISVALIFYASGALSELRATGSSFTEALAEKNITFILLCALALLSLLSIGYFLMNAFVAERASVPRAFFGVIAVLLFAIYSTFLYFNTELPINSPNKTVDQMAFLFCALFFLYEIRISLGRECWNLYIAFGFIAATLTAYSSLPSLIYYFVTGNTVSDTIYENVLSLCISIFITSRLLLANTLQEDKISDTVVLMKDASAQRSAYIADREELARHAYLEVYNRMTETNEMAEEPSEKELFPPITDPNGQNEHGEESDDASVLENQISIFDIGMENDDIAPADGSAVSGSKDVTDSDSAEADTESEADADSGSADADTESEADTDSGSADADTESEADTDGVSADADTESEADTDSGSAEADTESKAAAGSTDVDTPCEDTSDNEDADASDNETKRESKPEGEENS